MHIFFAPLYSVRSAFKAPVDEDEHGIPVAEGAKDALKIHCDVALEIHDKYLLTVS